MICSLCQREEVLEKVKIWHESETENYDMLWNVQCPVWHVQLRLFILPVSVYGDQDQPRLPRLPRPRAHLVRSEKFSRRWRRGGGWSCDCLSWHAAPPPADADIPWLGAVVIHTLALALPWWRDHNQPARKSWKVVTRTPNNPTAVSIPKSSGL